MNFVAVHEGICQSRATNAEQPLAAVLYTQVPLDEEKQVCSPIIVNERGFALRMIKFIAQYFIFLYVSYFVLVFLALK
jgi:hypothetical protein